MAEGAKKRVIVVTDGDRIAKAAVEVAARNVGGRTISASAGNPTPLTGARICELVKECEGDPVLVMVDDKGHSREGKGEKALAAIATDPELELLAVLAVASNTEGLDGTAVDFSVSSAGRVVQGSVDKSGTPQGGSARLVGDTLTVLGRIEVPLIVGIGDPGKMDEADALDRGAPILTEAIRQIINRSGENQGRQE